MQEKETNKTLWSRARQWLSPVRSRHSRTTAKINRPRIKWVLIFTALGLVLGLAYSFIVEGISSTTSSLGTGVITGFITNWIWGVYHRGKRELGAQVDEAIRAALSDVDIPRDRHAHYSERLREYYRSRNSSWAKSEEEQRLIKAFDERVAEQPTASNFRIEGLLKQADTVGMTDQYIQAILGELPVREGREATMRAIDQMLEAGRIHSESARDLIKEIASYVLEHTEELQAEIQRLRQSDNNSLAEALEGIRGVVGRESNQSLRGVLDAYSNREKQDEVRRLQDKARLLTELIEAAQTMFSFGEAYFFCERLLELEPATNRYADYALLLKQLREKILMKYRRWVQNNPQAYVPDLVRSSDNLISSLNDSEELDKKKRHYEETLRRYRKLSEGNPQVYKPGIASTLNNLGISLSYIGKFREAKAYHEEALKIRRELAKENPQAYMPDLATTLNNLGGLLMVVGEAKKALEHYEEALGIFRELAKKNPQAYKPNVAMTLNNLGLLLSDIGVFDRARKHYYEAVRLRYELVQKDPQAYMPNLAITLNNLGLLLMNIWELDEARKLYDEALWIYRELELKSPQAYKPDHAMTLNNFGKLLSYIGELDKAKDHLEDALKIRRELAEKNPQAYMPDVAMTQGNLALLYSQLERPEEAEQAYREARDTFRRLAQEQPAAYELAYAKTLIMGVDLLHRSTKELEEAQEILERQPKYPEARRLLEAIERLRQRAQAGQ